LLIFAFGIFFQKHFDEKSIKPSDIEINAQIPASGKNFLASRGRTSGSQRNDFRKVSRDFRTPENYVPEISIEIDIYKDFLKVFYGNF